MGYLFYHIFITFVFAFAALTAAIKKLFKDQKLRDKLSAQGLQTAKKYRWNVVMDKVEAFYKELAK